MNNLKIKKRKSCKITRKDKIKAVKGFKAVECIRNIRDEMYANNKDLNMKEYVKKILSEKKLMNENN